MRWSSGVSSGVSVYEFSALLVVRDRVSVTVPLSVDALIDATRSPWVIHSVPRRLLTRVRMALVSADLPDDDGPTMTVNGSSVRATLCRLWKLRTVRACSRGPRVVLMCGDTPLGGLRFSSR